MNHHVKKVAEVLEKAEVKLLYLPPYSPDLNPIEKMWSKSLFRIFTKEKKGSKIREKEKR